MLQPPAHLAFLLRFVYFGKKYHIQRSNFWVLLGHFSSLRPQNKRNRLPKLDSTGHTQSCYSFHWEWLNVLRVWRLLSLPQCSAKVCTRGTAWIDLMEGFFVPLWSAFKHAPNLCVRRAKEQRSFPHTQISKTVEISARYHCCALIPDHTKRNRKESKCIVG